MRSKTRPTCAILTRRKRLLWRSSVDRAQPSGPLLVARRIQTQLVQRFSRFASRNPRPTRPQKTAAAKILPNELLSSLIMTQPLPQRPLAVAAVAGFMEVTEMAPIIIQAD